MTLTLPDLWPHLQRQLCGWESAAGVPSATTFSRALIFAADSIPRYRKILPVAPNPSSPRR